MTNFAYDPEAYIKLAKEKFELQLRGGSLARQDYIYCPHCGNRQLEAYQYLPKEQEAWIGYECEMSECSKYFLMSYEKVFSTKKGER
jgi:hypothetical protein